MVRWHFAGRWCKENYSRRVRNGEIKHFIRFSVTLFFVYMNNHPGVHSSLYFCWCQKYQMWLQESIPNTVLSLRLLGLRSGSQLWPLLATPIPKGQGSLGPKGYYTHSQYPTFQPQATDTDNLRIPCCQGPKTHFQGPCWPLLWSLLPERAGVQPGAHPQACVVAKGSSLGHGRSSETWAERPVCYDTNAGL